jgi:hypothetical protein
MRQAAQQRSGREQRQANLKDAPPPELVRERARKHQQAGNGQPVRVENPLQPG